MRLEITEGLPPVEEFDGFGSEVFFGLGADGNNGVGYFCCSLIYLLVS